MKPITSERVIRDFIKDILLENNLPSALGESEFNSLVDSFLSDLSIEDTPTDMRFVSKTKVFFATIKPNKKAYKIAEEAISQKSFSKFMTSVNLQKFG